MCGIKCPRCNKRQDTECRFTGYGDSGVCSDAELVCETCENNSEIRCETYGDVKEYYMFNGVKRTEILQANCIYCEECLRRPDEARLKRWKDTHFKSGLFFYACKDRIYVL